MRVTKFMAHVGLIVLLLGILPANAQTAPPAAPVYYTKTEPGQWIIRLRKGGITLQDTKSNTLGIVQGMIMNKDSTVHAYIVRHDTFLRFGGTYAAVSAGSFSRTLDDSKYIDNFTLQSTPEALKKAPVFSDQNK